MVYDAVMHRLIIIVISLVGLPTCSKKAEAPSPCRQFAELQVKCKRFTGTVENLTSGCEMFSEKEGPESAFDLTNESDYKMVFRLRTQRRGAACAVKVKDCEALAACMEAALAKEPPLPPPPQRPADNEPPPPPPI